MSMDHWTFQQPSQTKDQKQSKEKTQTVKVSGNFRTDNGEAIRDACVNGLGITINSTWSAYSQIMRGELVEVLPQYPLDSKADIWVVYPSSRQLAAKVRAFIDFFSLYFSGTPYWDQELQQYQKLKETP